MINHSTLTLPVSQKPTHEYTWLKAEDFNEEEWKELKRYAAFLAMQCGPEYDVEEMPETTVKEGMEEITFGGFIGIYRFVTSDRSLVIKPNPQKLSEKEFEKIIEEVSEWATMLGPPFLKALLTFYSPIKGEYELRLGYSDLLLKYTQLALWDYLPPLVERRRYIAPMPVGRILLQPTIKQQSRGRQLYVSERAKVTLESLPRLLVYRFHAEVSMELRRLQDRLQEDSKVTEIQICAALRNHLANHERLLTDPRNRAMLSRSLEIDFKNPEVLERVEREASKSPTFRDLTYLWEAYIGRRALHSQIREILAGGYMLKPLSKLYELWCLRFLLDLLKDLCGKYKYPANFPGAFKFVDYPEGRMELFYNMQPPGALSHIVKDLQKVGLGVSISRRPDFTLLVSGPSRKEMCLILDAKYKVLSDIGKEDLSRFFWYLVDYTSSRADQLEGVILYVPGEDDQVYNFVKREAPQVNLHLVGLKPNSSTYEEARKHLEDIISPFLCP